MIEIQIQIQIKRYECVVYDFCVLSTHRKLPTSTTVIMTRVNPLFFIRSKDGHVQFMGNRLIALSLLKILEFESPKIKHRFYFRTLKLLHRRFAQSQVREQRLQRMRRQLALRKERRLPLIKRQSAMQYAQQEELQSSPSLKALSVDSKTETSSGRETVIKSVSAVREKLDCGQEGSEEPKEMKNPSSKTQFSLEEHCSDSNHIRLKLINSFLYLLKFQIVQVIIAIIIII